MVREASVVEKSALTLKPTRGLDPQRLIIAAKIDRLAWRTATRRGRPCAKSRWYEQPAPRPSPLTVLGQVLGHQETDQVTRASAAWPLRPGWKKSRVLTWLALNR